MTTKTFLLLIVFAVVSIGTNAKNPEVCNLPKFQGPCRAAIPRFYYNSDTGECEQFIYGGCDGNANNFDTKEECEKKCK
ncbi:unnamed protein product [Pocillopora meandrina]|uniref:BPTI/Kunitz inhibitor domain-containing protein n=1 Tax=Pocillopora meandrina TaxID=46732 RepID=A0AAU9X5F0_9CNID|nr:unnamed protein product [Pocillopora meandrina]